MTTCSPELLEKGARNLLLNCAKCQPGQSVLIVYETEDDGYYDPQLVHTIQQTARALNLRPTTYGVPLSRSVQDPDATLLQMLKQADCTVFLARLGDQIRFRPKDASLSQIVSYALDCDMLASPFGTVDYSGFEQLKHLLNAAFETAFEVRVTCPAGTDFTGGPVAFAPFGADVTRKRFPVSVFTPVPAGTFRGRIAQTGFLTGTGSHYYAPYTCRIDDTLFVDFEGARITGFDGTPRDIAAAREHYEFVGQTHGIDTYHVHSWHAGIHPGCAYTAPAADNFERWSGGAFGNPRLLHIHTCGAYPPGEISLNILDPTVTLDGVAVWENGRLYPERIDGGAALLAENPEMYMAFQSPAPEVGQAPSGRLAYGASRLS